MPGFTVNPERQADDFRRTIHRGTPEQRVLRFAKGCITEVSLEEAEALQQDIGQGIVPAYKDRTGRVRYGEPPEAAVAKDSAPERTSRKTRREADAATV